jgi:hypothetical protein
MGTPPSVGIAAQRENWLPSRRRCFLQIPFLGHSPFPNIPGVPHIHSRSAYAYIGYGYFPLPGKKLRLVQKSPHIRKILY